MRYGMPRKPTVLHSDPGSWWRGPARADGDDIVMDGAMARPYEPVTVPLVGLELTKVRTPQDAVRFVEQFGLLNIPDSFWRRKKAPREVRQSFAEFEWFAEDLRRIVRYAANVRAGVKGDAAAVRWLRDDLCERVRHHIREGAANGEYLWFLERVPGQTCIETPEEWLRALQTVGDQIGRAHV